jgi:hypothetical protein
MPSLKITNLKDFEARLSGGVENLSKKTFKAVKKDAEVFLGGLADSVANSSDFKELKSDSELRGKLGLATSAKKTGGDTDAENLIIQLRKFKVRTRSVKGGRKFTVTFPSIQELEDKLTHNLSKVKDGTIRRGPTVSWFRWWEHGDRGEIDSLTILRKTVSKLISKKSGKPRNSASRGSLLDIITKRSRSNEAIQLLNRQPDENSSIAPTRLVQRTYANFARVFPARMGKTLKKIVLENNGRAEKFFARGVIR